MRGRKFWLVYAVAWLPLAASYAATFAADGHSSAGNIFRAVFANVVPAALLGLPALWLCARLRWLRPSRVAFFAVHLAAAAAFSILWWAAASLALSAIAALASGAWAFTPLVGPALHWQIFSGLLVYGTIASVAYMTRAMHALAEERERAARAEAERAWAELRALRAQLSPHFLFNLLHSIMALVRYSPAEAESALERFAEMMRYVLRVERESGEVDVALADELAFVESYLALERLRLGDRLRVVRGVEEEALDCALPAFTLQPLVENAIKHGIAPIARAGTLRLEAGLEGDELVLLVEDDGPGVSPGAVEASTGMGLAALRRRVDLRYGSRGSVDVATVPGGGFRVTLRLPAAAAVAREDAWLFAR